MSTDIPNWHRYIGRGESVNATCAIADPRVPRVRKANYHIVWASARLYGLLILSQSNFSMLDKTIYEVEDVTVFKSCSTSQVV